MCIVGTGVAMAASGAIARGEILVERQVAEVHVIPAPSFGSTYESMITMPRFDTLNDTRELVSARIFYGIAVDYVGHRSGNTDPNLSIGTAYQYRGEWSGSIGGETPLPTPYGNNPGGVVEDTGFGITVIEPNSDAPPLDIYSSGVDSFVDAYPALTHPDILNTLTGTGVLDISSRYTLDFEYLEPQAFCEMYPFACGDGGGGDPGGGGGGPAGGGGGGPAGRGVPTSGIDVWDTGSFSLDFSNVRIEIYVDYNYRNVPAPGAASLIGLAGLAATRRRR